MSRAIANASGELASAVAGLGAGDQDAVDAALREAEFGSDGEFAGRTALAPATVDEYQLR